MDFESAMMHFEFQSAQGGMSVPELMFHQIAAREEKIKQLTSALEHIAGIVKLDAFAFNELAAQVYESALNALGKEEVPAR